jgi:hypothetical protein
MNFKLTIEKEAIIVDSFSMRLSSNLDRVLARKSKYTTMPVMNIPCRRESKQGYMK